MRRIILLAIAVLALVGSTALAQGAFPKKIALPNAFAPEGIEVGNGHTVYVGSVGTGAVWVGDLRRAPAGSSSRARRTSVGDRDRAQPR